MSGNPHITQLLLLLFLCLSVVFNLEQNIDFKNVKKKVKINIKMQLLYNIFLLFVLLS